MNNPICVADVEKIAKKIVLKPAWDYFRNGANEEQTLIDNCNAFQRYRLRPKVLVDVSSVDMTTTVLGSKVDFPICIAATAMNRMAHPHGEVAVAKAAALQNTGFMFSTWATSSVEEISTASPNSLKWLQLYIYKDREITKQLVERAERCGYKGIFLTVDTPVIGLRYRDVRNKFSLPQHLRLGNFEGIASQVRGANNSGLADYVNSLIDPSLQWSDVTWLKSITKLPIVLKGIITGEMAKQALTYGVDGILVSNHGARQLDGVPATIDALPEVVKAVQGQCEVYLDGGVRTGTDVLKALALGARAVFVGRPAIWGLAYKGEKGVVEVLNIMKKELKTSIQLMGYKTIHELQNENNLVVRESYYKSSL